MNRHDAFVIIAAQERYAELLKMAEQERRLRAVDDTAPTSSSGWGWLRPWFQKCALAFPALTKMPCDSDHA